MKPHDGPVSDLWHFARPELAEGYLNAFDLKLSSARGFFAPRRMGKTEFLLQDLLPAAQKRGYIVAYTNLWDNRASPEAALVAALFDALGLRSAQALSARPDRPAQRGNADAKTPGTLEAKVATCDGKEPTLQEAIRKLDEQRKTFLLVIDEAQVLARTAHSDFVHALRAALDIRKARVKVIFTGSSGTALRAMFARPSEPFYHWAALEPLPPLGGGFVDFTVKLMNSMARKPMTAKQGRRAFTELNDTPEFFRRFIERYMLHQVLGPDSALRYTKASVFSDEHLHEAWSDMNPADQAVLTLIARGDSDLHSANALGRISASLEKTATKSTVAHALRRLQAGNVVTRVSFGEYRIEEEAFADWIRQRTAGIR
ncbi:ATP-binding protein [Noviherbaspirillum pedocola]|uniref:ATPase domain-containing protein n=1 Tax=Noviherbaspirillum pedocola TaxID=2801341 RepID=A0A934SU08_9BURK|nr:hypothetical protein [Noviherbaspirillum pedocola]MBK4735529.1 hypothetical protein [Noviherbaspirillum pedocola]